MLHHYITKYEEDGRQYAEAWLQVDFFGRSWCFSRRRVEAGKCAVVRMSMTDEQARAVRESIVQTVADLYEE